MNKEKAVNRINGIGKIGHVITIVARVALIIGFVAAIIGLIVILALPENLFALKLSGDAKLELNLSDISLASKVDESIKDAMANADVSIGTSRYTADSINVSSDGSLVTVDMKGDGGIVSPRRISMLIWAAIVYIILTFVLMTFLGKLCKSLSCCHSPFEESIIKSLQYVAWSLIPFALVDSTMSSLIASAFSANVSLSFGVNISTILFILLIFGLAYVFKYGAVLQTESDETL